MARAVGSSLIAAALKAMLSSSGRLEKESLGRQISRLTDRVGELQDEVCTMLDQRYVQFLPSVESARNLESETEQLFSRIDQLKSMIETEVQQDLNVALAEFTKLKQELERDTLVLSVLKQLQEIDSALKQFSVLLSKKKYIPAACLLKKAQECLKNMESRQGFKLKILKALHIELVAQTENILAVLSQEWHQLAVWKFPKSKETDRLESALQTELRLCRALPREDTSSSPSATSVLHGFAILGELHYKFKVFGQLLLNYILKPLIGHSSLQILLEAQSDAVVLRFETVVCHLHHSSPIEVFTKLKPVLAVLHKYLAVPPDHCLKDENNTNVVLTRVLGEVIWKELSDCLTDGCLVNSIPKNSSKLEEYIEVVKATEEFEQALKDMQFLKENSTDLVTYACNFKHHFVDKKCRDVMVTARNLMMSEIHKIIKITPESSVALANLPDPVAGYHISMLMESNVVAIQTRDLETKTRLSQHTFSFPACCISKFIPKLMTLAYETLEEASASTDQWSIKLFYLVRNIFYLFCDVVPVYHKENLQKIPQLTAIHHNNCMYIAHHLLILGHQFQSCHRGLLCGSTTTFVDLVPVFRRLGTECFLAQMRVQKGELLERLASARDFSTMDDEDSYATANKAVRQVLNQLKRLGKVWQGILPVNVYCKAIGTLLNTALMEIINRILALEDISAENADRLYVLCEIMVKEGPQVFVPLSEEKQNRTFQEEVPLYVSKWMMFKELMLVLQANLHEIMNRWADSKGPLAAEFSSGQVKNLIRALFQNTERRAAVLAKIQSL